MKKVLAILLSIVIILVALWYTPYTSSFMRKKVISTYAVVLGKIGVKEQNVKMFVPALQSNIGVKEISAKRGYLDKKNIYISNSKSMEFSGNLFQIDEVSLDIDVDSLSTDMITINDITIDGFKFIVDTKDGVSNVESTVNDVANYLLSNRLAFLGYVMNMSSEDPQEASLALSNLAKLIFGDYQKFVDSSIKISLASIGHNSDLISMLNDESSLLEGSHLLVKKMVISNSAMVVNGKTYSLPNLELKNLSSSSEIMQDSQSDNIEALTEFNKNLSQQENNIMELQPIFMDISSRVGAIVQQTILNFMAGPSDEESEI